MWCAKTVVMSGLDPGIHSVTANCNRNGMDCRVKPGNDNKEGGRKEQHEKRQCVAK